MSFVIELEGALCWHKQEVTAIDFDEANQMMVTGSRDKKVVLWNLSDPKPKVPGVPEKSFTGHSHYISDVHFSETGNYILSSSWDQTLRLHNVRNPLNKDVLFTGHKKDILACCINNNKLIVSGGRDGIRLWNVKGESCGMIEIPANDSMPIPVQRWVVSLVCVPQGNDSPLIVAATYGGSVFVFRKANKGWTVEKEWDAIKELGAPVQALCSAPDGSLVAGAARNGRIGIWDVASNSLVYTLGDESTSPANAVRFMPDHFCLVAATEANVALYDLDNKKLAASVDLVDEEEDNTTEGRSTSKPAPAKCVACTEDGRLLVGAKDGRVFVYSVHLDE